MNRDGECYGRLTIAGLLAVFALPGAALGQFASSAPTVPQATVNVSPSSTPPGQAQYSGSVVKEKPTAGVLQLTIVDAIQRGLKYNLGYVLQNANVESAGGEKLQQLQPLLPTVQATARASVQQIDLAAEGLRVPGIPSVIGPFGSVDARGSLVWSVLNLPALNSYLAARHNFEGSKLSLDDARDLVVLTVGNAYLVLIADLARIQSTTSQVASTKASLDQAVSNHLAGISPLLDEVRARVDYQTQQQNLINAQNTFAKDKIALARAIGLPLEQQFEISTNEPYPQFENVTVTDAEKTALQQRSDLNAMRAQAKAARETARGAHEERLPSLAITGDYGVAGINLGDLHGTGEAIGQGMVPVYEEEKIRGDEKIADAQATQHDAQVSSMEGQVVADVRDAVLDIETAQKTLEVAQSNVSLSTEALSEAQQRFAAGVSDNLSVVQAQASVAQANEQYIESLYQSYVARLELARAMGITRSTYQQILGGK